RAFLPDFQNEARKNRDTPRPWFRRRNVLSSAVARAPQLSNRCDVGILPGHRGEPPQNRRHARCLAQPSYRRSVSGLSVAEDFPLAWDRRGRSGKAQIFWTHAQSRVGKSSLGSALLFYVPLGDARENEGSNERRSREGCNRPVHEFCLRPARPTRFHSVWHESCL